MIFFNKIRETWYALGMDKLIYALSAKPWNDGRQTPQLVKTGFILGMRDEYPFKHCFSIFLFHNYSNKTDYYIDFGKWYIKWVLPRWYCWIKEYFKVAYCRLRNHPQGQIYFNAYGLEPNNRCRGCYEEI